MKSFSNTKLLTRPYALLCFVLLFLSPELSVVKSAENEIENILDGLDPLPFITLNRHPDVQLDWDSNSQQFIPASCVNPEETKSVCAKDKFKNKNWSDQHAADYQKLQQARETILQEQTQDLMNIFDRYGRVPETNDKDEKPFETLINLKSVTSVLNKVKQLKVAQCGENAMFNIHRLLKLNDPTIKIQEIYFDAHPGDPTKETNHYYLLLNSNIEDTVIENKPQQVKKLMRNPQNKGYIFDTWNNFRGELATTKNKIYKEGFKFFQIKTYTTFFNLSGVPKQAVNFLKKEYKQLGFALTENSSDKNNQFDTKKKMEL